MSHQSSPRKKRGTPSKRSSTKNRRPSWRAILPSYKSTLKFKMMIFLKRRKTERNWRRRTTNKPKSKNTNTTWGNGAKPASNRSWSKWEPTPCPCACWTRTTRYYSNTKGSYREECRTLWSQVRRALSSGVPFGMEWHADWSPRLVLNSCTHFSRGSTGTTGSFWVSRRTCLS